MASFNYAATMSPGGLSEQLGHLAGVIAGANATNRATDVANRRADIDQAFREAQLQHYKNMEERQGLSGAMNPLQQAHIDEAKAHADYFRHLTDKQAAVKPPAMIPNSQQPLPIPGVLPTSNEARTQDPAFSDTAPSSMIRHVQDTLVMPTVRDKIRNGTPPAEAQTLMKTLMDQSMGPLGYVYDDHMQHYVKGQTLAPETPATAGGMFSGPGTPASPSYVDSPVPPWGTPGPLSDGAGPPRAHPENDSPAPGGMGADTDAFGNALGPVPASPPVAPGGLGAAMAAPAPPMGMAAMNPSAVYNMNSMFGSAPAPAAPTPPAPAAPPAAPTPNGKVIPGSALKAKAAQLYGGDLNAAMAHAQALGYTIDQSR